METLARYALSIGAVAALLVASSSSAHSATASATEQARVRHSDCVDAGPIGCSLGSQASRPQRIIAEVVRKGAKILGFVDARLRALHSFRDFIEQPEYERAITKVSHELGREQFSEFMSAGASLTEDQVVEIATAAI